MDPQTLRTTLQHFTSSPDSSTTLSTLPEETRRALLQQSTLLSQQLENPLETVIRLHFAVLGGVALRLGDSMNIFSKAIHKGLEQPISIQELSQESAGSEIEADPELVHRIMRLLVGYSLFTELPGDPPTYLPRPVCAAFVHPSPLNAVVRLAGAMQPAAAFIPDFLKSTGFKNPKDAWQGPWQYAFGTDRQHYFEWLRLKGNEEVQDAFNMSMTVSRAGRGEEWFQFYPVEKTLRDLGDGGGGGDDEDEKKEILMVDIGGGIGHDLIAFRKHFPNLPGRLVLEDLKTVVEAQESRDLIKTSGVEIETVSHDFFKPQPLAELRGARFYYLRTVLHDWPDSQCKVILGHIRDVMVQGKKEGREGILLLNENSIPEKNPSLYAAQMDLLMMTCFSSLDRMETHFRSLLEESGFTVRNVWRPKVVLEGSAVLFEAVVKD